jgi:hypothetical protein
MVLVTRATDYELLLARHGTRGQAKFFLKNRGQCINEVESQHTRFTEALATVHHAVPRNWRSTRIDRGDLDRFLFEPGDVVVALGQDGLVANLAKYLDGQIVVGLNPMPERFPGVLVQHSPKDARELLNAAVSGSCATDTRTMVEAVLDDGQTLRCLNEVFVGHASHQSARYEIEVANQRERQSSSGMIVATGTGATGWARSVHLARKSELTLPNPNDGRLAYFVREPWPSIATGTDIVEGLIDSQHTLVVTSEMDEQGVIFGDGIESDRMTFGYGRRVEIRPAAQSLNLLAA